MILFILIILIILFIYYYKYIIEKYTNNIDINIIYYAYVTDDRKERAQMIINAQLDELIESNVLDNKNNKLYIVLCISDNNFNELKTILDNKLANYNYEISYTPNNNYEYPGIKKLYDLACISPEKLYLYFHSKGVYYHHNNNDIINRDKWEKYLTKNTIQRWKDVINIVLNDPSVTRIGLFPCSFVWTNFFWATGKYLSECSEPIINEDRYYYEGWLSTNPNIEKSKVYSLYSNNNDTYTPEDIHAILD